MSDSASADPQSNRLPVSGSGPPARRQCPASAVGEAFVPTDSECGVDVVGGGGDNDEKDDDDQPALMEARLRELISSLRQLINSNRLLEEALDVNHDEELYVALMENVGAIARKRERANAIAHGLRARHRVHVSSEDEIPEYDGSVVLARRRTMIGRGGVIGVDEDGGMHL
jgi:hypothetical protein